MPHPICRHVLALATLGALVAPVRTQAPVVDYAIVDRIESDWINRNPVPVRPMAIDLDGSIWAVNPYLGAICRITGGTVQSFRTLPGPVSVAIQPELGRIYVACQHANAVAVHSTSTGDIVDVVFVPAQPQDLLLNAVAPRRLWVSCAAADAVVSVDTADVNGSQTTYSIPSKSPTFLTLGPNDQVLVAPRVSGNGSLVDRQPDLPRGTGSFPNGMAGPRGIIDTLDPTAVDMGLPDRDLFWLEPSILATGTATPVAKTTGTMLFAGAIRPGTGSEYWQLNTDANNNDPDLQSEAAIRGRIVDNRITMVTLPSLTHPMAQPAPSIHVIRVLDITQNQSPNLQLGIPYSIAFRGDGARCWIAGLLTDNIVEFNQNGNRTGRAVKFAKGAMPRQVLYGANNSTLHVWCADNKVRTHVLTTATTTAVSLGFDPTPADIQAGRKLFFDGSHSQFGNASCASCHDEGKTDMLAWNLSKIDATVHDGLDNKGPMVTQTLVGIDRAMPFHWRGEQRRGLLDFNAAFVNLLGGTTGIDEANGDFGKFERYVLSLTEDANQFEHPERKLVDAQVASPSGFVNPTGNPAQGQDNFFQVNPATGLSCFGCHTLPTGSSNEIVSNSFEFTERRPRRLWIKIAPFQGMQFKAAQPQETVDLVPDDVLDDLLSYPVSGTGLSHAGVINNIENFTRQMAPAIDTDIAHFVLRFDTGTAPAAHCATYQRPGQLSTGPLTAAKLLAQALTQRNCDLAVIGRATINGTSRVAGWLLLRSTGQFLRDDGVQQSAQALQNLAVQPGNWLAMIGMPVGTARGFAIDFDRDGLLNELEPPIAGSMFNVDSDGDGDWDGHEFQNGGDPANPMLMSNDMTPPGVNFLPPSMVSTLGGPWPYQWHTQRVARLTFDTTELATAVLTLTTNGAPPVVARDLAPQRQHDLLVNTLLPGRTYTGVLQILDQGGNPPSAVTIPDLTLVTPAAPLVPPAPPFDPVLAPRQAAIVKALDWSSQVPNGNDLQLQASGEIYTRNDDAPLANARVIARVLIDGRPATVDQISGSSVQTNFSVGGLNYDRPPMAIGDDADVEGPFVIAPVTDSLGRFAMDFTLNDVLLTTPTTVELVIEAIGDEVSAVPTIDIRTSLSGFPLLAPSTEVIPQLFSLPDTVEDFRAIRLILP